MKPVSKGHSHKLSSVEGVVSTKNKANQREVLTKCRVPSMGVRPDSEIKPASGGNSPGVNGEGRGRGDCRKKAS
jgi:hypothetical protein